MRTDRELTRTVKSWLEDGVNVLPDRVLDDVLAKVPSTRQRRVTWWPARTVIDMNRNFRLAGAAAAVIVVVVIGAIGLGLMRQQGVAAPVPTSSPATDPTQAPTGAPTGSPSAVPTATPISLSTVEGGSLEPGTYLADEPFEIPFTVTLEDQWDLVDPASEIMSFYLTDAVNGNASVSVMLPQNVYPDPCNPDDGPLDPPVERTVDGLVGALTNMTGWAPGPVTDLAVGGLTGKNFVLTPPLSDPAECNGGLPPLVTFLNEPFTGATNTDLYDEMTVVDVDGTPVVILSEWHGGTSSASRAAMQQVARSISFD